MVKLRRIAAAAGAAAVFAPLLYGQDAAPAPRARPIRSDSIERPNQASVLFDKSLNTYHWRGVADYGAAFGNESLILREEFLSTILRTERNLIRDESSLEMRLRSRRSPSLAATALVSSYVLSDDQSVGINNASTHGLYGGLEFRPYRGVVLEPLAGMRFDNQIDQKDRGPSLLFAFAADDIDLNGSTAAARGRAQLDRLSARTLETHGDSVSLRTPFFGRTQNSLRLIFNRNRRDFYFPAGAAVSSAYGVTHNIETRSDNAVTVGDALDYDIGGGGLLSFDGSIFSRSIGRTTLYKNLSDIRSSAPNTTTEEFRIDGSAQVLFRGGGRWKGSSRFLYQERDERHLVQNEEAFADSIVSPFRKEEEKKNNHARRTSLAAEAEFVPDEGHVIGLSGSTNLLRYDTPDASNEDDRDELAHVLSLRTRHRVNDYLLLSTVSEAQLSHVVYLAGTRSNSNAWNRIFRFSPLLEYAPSRSFSSANSFEVLANYTVFDFEFTPASAHSFAFRQFSFSDSTEWNITGHVALEWFSLLRLYERGELRWSDFSERVINSFEDKTVIASARYDVDEGLLFSAGIRYFSQSRYGTAGSERLLETALESIGPITHIEWHSADRTRLDLRGWYEHQTFTGQTPRNVATVTMSFIVKI